MSYNKLLLENLEFEKIDKREEKSNNEKIKGV
jgi:hypothetical protein